MQWEWVILPVVGSAIGWLTNFLAIRMLFRPKRPVRLGSGLNIQGVLPRRQEELARVVAETVERDLLPMEELLETLDVAKYESDVLDTVVGYVDKRLEKNLPDLLPAQLRKAVADYARRLVAKEATHVVAGATERVKARIREDVRLGEVVREKMIAFDTDQLERIVVRVAGTELRAIEALGAVLGFVIGAVQAFLVTRI